MGNLAGGKWGLAQFAWLPRAVEFGLGPPVADAFRGLVDVSKPLAERVERFRDELDVVEGKLETRGGFLPTWRRFRPAASFVALVLGGYGPAAYTFYAKGVLRSGYERFMPAALWPKGSMGEIYAEVCGFVRAVAACLTAKGAPVQDLIDAQSFLWLSYQPAQPPLPSALYRNRRLRRRLAASIRNW